MRVLPAFLIALLPLGSMAEETAPRTLNTPREFPTIESRAAWEARATEIREQILVSCGLWPLPEKTPLKATVFGKLECDGYTVEKVHFQPYPGFYLGGNLYRPLGKGAGPFPAILNPHGHWENGRMADEEAGSIRARCISFARQGMIAFSYDMVGYNDTGFAGGDPKKVHRGYGTQPTDQLWNINEMGLQTWNSIRALDFLEGLPDVDRKRLACTGESGGGTQTFILGAIDGRLAAQVPVVMVSHSMQGGCNCENAPGLRIDYSNMEIAAAAAPRPQLIVGATGDWTKTTMEVEGPAIAGIYKLLGVEDRFKAERFNFGHNYNQTSREAVYDWLGHRLLEKPDPALLKEQPYKKLPDEDLRVFPDGKLPADALTMEQFIAARKEERKQQWQKLVPTDAAGLERFKKTMLPAWRHTLQTDWAPDLRESKRAVESPLKENVVVSFEVVEGEEAKGVPEFEHSGQTSLVKVKTSAPDPKADEFSAFFSTYNRSALQGLVSGQIELCQGLREVPQVKRIVLVGRGRAGIPALLAAPVADAVAVDCGGRSFAGDEELISPGFFAPGLRGIGTFSCGALLAAPRPLLLFNTDGQFPTADIETAYRAVGQEKQLTIVKGRMTQEEILKWVAEL
ncbi:acetylxylan esterase [Haloferula sp. BvORR071]|uniref:alpha/beta hydrolase family protein n=1 Tax=Haloferula sp. BvORR071 TaxID=1396141 RepID=UPI00069899ED|nr:acetylxylan esterase [Haloferula sp. BvORR071]